MLKIAITTIEYTALPNTILSAWHNDMAAFDEIIEAIENAKKRVYVDSSFGEYV
ncbi:MAG: hypothetical protein LBH45_01780 [Campylobacteraceae bacterium]|jgi:hypothetical protein|nr:hypothetical protein [Campylobacteraceae bacterium]